MKIYKIFITIYFYLFLFVSMSLPGRSQDLVQEYVEIAFNNNAGLKSKFNEYMAALEKVPQAGALPDPQLAFGYFIQPVETRLGPQQARISVTQMFPWFGALNAKENSAESFAKAQYEMFEEARSKLFYKVKATYYNLYFTQKAIHITQENISILQSFKNLANIKVESGSASTVDAYRVEMEINDLENQLALLKDNLWAQKVKFIKLLNVNDDYQVSISDALINSEVLLDKESQLDSVLRNNNALSVFDFQIDALEHNKEAASKAGLPQISIGLDYTIIGEGEVTANNAGQDAIMFPKIGITVPLYRKKYKAMVQEVVYLQEAKSNAKTDKENMLTILFEEVWKNYQDASRRVILYEKQTELASKSLSILESGYATSNKDFEELLRMERKLLKYALELQKSYSDREASIAFLHYLQGK